MTSENIRVAVATLSDDKIEAVRDFFMERFPEKHITVDSVDVDSDVPNQPQNGETLEGVKNRIKNLEKKTKPCNYDYLVAIEAGLIQILDEWFNVHIAGISCQNGEIYGLSQGFPVPKEDVPEILRTCLQKEFLKKDSQEKGLYGCPMENMQDLILQELPWRWQPQSSNGTKWL